MVLYLVNLSSLLTPLLNDKHSVVHHLFFEKCMNVQEECPQMFLSISIWHNYSNTMASSAVGRLITATQIQMRKSENKDIKK